MISNYDFENLTCRIWDNLNSILPEFELAKDRNGNWASTNTLHLSDLHTGTNKGKVYSTSKAKYYIADWREPKGEEIISYFQRTRNLASRNDAILHLCNLTFTEPPSWLASDGSTSQTQTPKPPQPAPAIQTAAPEPPEDQTSQKRAVTDAYRLHCDNYTEYSLKTFLLQYFRHDYSDHIKQVLSMFGTTGDKYGNTLFWYVSPDLKGAETAKVMQYKSDGHRDKARNPYGIHKQYGYKPTHYFYGLHQLHPSMQIEYDRIGIVESEKTAIIATIVSLLNPAMFGNIVFIATGGASFFDAALRNSKATIQAANKPVIVYPDSDAASAKWDSIANANGWELVRIDGTSDGYDLADLLLDCYEEQRPKQDPTPAPEYETDISLLASLPYGSTPYITPGK